MVCNLARFTNAKKIVSVTSPLQEEAGLDEALRSCGIEVYTDQADIAAHAATADIGISGVEFGIAETGSVCQDGYAIESRLVSTLPPSMSPFLTAGTSCRGSSRPSRSSPASSTAATGAGVLRPSYQGTLSNT
ncbi:MAG: LUD domain-containing protein [Candidatus Moduliflexus flocculans]|nr:LUD domain-containing protein [Candidatus Moduliflexus flocculans]